MNLPDPRIFVFLSIAPPRPTSATSLRQLPAPKFLIDLGATHNVLSDSYVESTGLLHLATESKRQITGFDGSCKTSLYQIDLKLDHDPATLNFIITRLKDAYNGILGMLWLKSHGHLINWRSGIATGIDEKGKGGDNGSTLRLEGLMPTPIIATSPRATEVSHQSHNSGPDEVIRPAY
ncbi:hypothetical protein PSTG_14016 [Puccinia striiformis f. sp. tritici PST-78]|uniref:Peptidase A2 domain-containing protein n=1 Tax=Puccinia striiformis f. sp. tritici PST-78 TaxID=1165861 RepID=A0A0L0UZW6_9BASI|nr:hypothetical protein PSTG_14016 [Puccinia striiformis f. sp. tritici PST-78]